MDEAHEERADELERQADHLEKASDSVGEQIKDMKEDWETKKSGNQAPGAADHADAAPGGLGEEEEDDEDAEAEAEQEDE